MIDLELRHKIEYPDYVFINGNAYLNQEVSNLLDFLKKHIHTTDKVIHVIGIGDITRELLSEYARRKKVSVLCIKPSFFTGDKVKLYKPVKLIIIGELQTSKERLINSLPKGSKDYSINPLVVQKIEKEEIECQNVKTI